MTALHVTECALVFAIESHNERVNDNVIHSFVTRRSLGFKRARSITFSVQQDPMAYIIFLVWSSRETNFVFYPLFSLARYWYCDLVLKTLVSGTCNILSQ